MPFEMPLHMNDALRENDGRRGAGLRHSSLLEPNVPLLKNIYKAGMSPAGYMCNDAFLPLEGAVPPSKGKQILFDQAVRVTCSVELCMQV